MDILGIKGDTDLQQLQRSPQVMRALFRRRAKMLRPDRVPEDAKRMAALVNAYTFLTGNEQGKVNYYLGNKPSIDAQLGIVREGHDVFGSYDPEHQSLDHLLMKGEAEGAFGAAEALGTQRTFSDFTRVYKEQTGMEARGVGDEKELPTVAPPQPGEKLRPQKGKDITFLLKLSFEEGAHGCKKEISYERQKRCAMCRGSGRAGVVHSRCPQCHGRGQTKMRSGTYDMSAMCDFCMGHGKVPPRLCGACKGHCTIPSTETYTVSVPSASASMTELWVQRRGHDGKRGGVGGNLVVTLMISEHRIFHTRGLDLHAVLPIPLTVALLGGFVTAPSLDGPQRVHIRPMTASGDIYTIAGQGISDRLAGGKRHTAEEEEVGSTADANADASSAAMARGDLKIHTVVVVPSAERLSARQMAAMEELKAIEDRELAALRAAAEAEAEESGGVAEDAFAAAENATRRPPRTYEGEAVPVGASPSTTAAADKKEAPVAGEGNGIPLLRRKPVPRQPVEPAKGENEEDEGAIRRRSSPFFSPKRAPTAAESAAVPAPSLDELAALKDKHRAWLPVTRALGDH